MSCLQIVEKSDSWFAIILFLLIIFIAFIVEAKIKCNLYIHYITLRECSRGYRLT